MLPHLFVFFLPQFLNSGDVSSFFPVAVVPESWVRKSFYFWSKMRRFVFLVIVSRTVQFQSDVLRNFKLQARRQIVWRYAVGLSKTKMMLCVRGFAR